MSLAEKSNTQRENQTKLLTSALETTRVLENQPTHVELKQNDQYQRIAEPDQSVHVKRIFGLQSLESVHTVLHDCNYHLPAVTYDNIGWKLTVRKQVI